MDIRFDYTSQQVLTAHAQAEAQVQAGALAQMGQRDLAACPAESRMNQEPSYDPNGILTELQQRHLAERLPSLKREDFAYMMYSDLSDSVELPWMKTALESINQSNESETEKNFQLLQKLRGVGGKSLTQQSVLNNLKTCELGGVASDVFEPENNTGGTAVLEQITELQSQLTPEHLAAVFKMIEQQDSTPLHGFKTTAILMQRLPDDASRLECLRQAVEITRNTAISADVPLQQKDIMLLAQVLSPLGPDVDSLALRMLSINEYHAIKQSSGLQPSSYKLMLILNQLISAQGVTHHSTDQYKPLSVQKLASCSAYCQ